MNKVTVFKASEVTDSLSKLYISKSYHGIVATEIDKTLTKFVPLGFKGERVGIVRVVVRKNNSNEGIICIEHFHNGHSYLLKMGYPSKYLDNNYSLKRFTLEGYLSEFRSLELMLLMLNENTGKVSSALILDDLKFIVKNGLLFKPDLKSHERLTTDLISATVKLVLAKRLVKKERGETYEKFSKS